MPDTSQTTQTAKATSEPDHRLSDGPLFAAIEAAYILAAVGR